MCTNNPIVTVVIPAYNAARWIGETLDSVLAQSFPRDEPDLEVIVVDDGSTDETSELVRAYGSRVRYLRKENGGAAAARNAGILAARGSYIAFVDADDLWMPEKLQMQMDLFSEHPDLVWAYCDAVVFDDQSGRDLYRAGATAKLHVGDILRPLLLGCFIPSPTPIIRREVFETVGYFDESPLMRIGEDWNMWLRIAAKYPVGLVDQPLARLRVHSASTTAQMDLRYALQSKLLVVESAIARDPARLSDLRNRAVAKLYVGMGEYLVQRGDRIGAREMFGRAIRHYPYEARTIVYWATTLLPEMLLNRLIAMRRRFRRGRLSLENR